MWRRGAAFLLVNYPYNSDPAAVPTLPPPSLVLQPDLTAPPPSLPTLQPDLLRVHFVSLMQQLGLPRGEVEGMIRRCPRLLALSPTEFKQQLAGLEAALYLRPPPPPPPPQQLQPQQQLGGVAGGSSAEGLRAEGTQADVKLAQASALWPQLLLQDTGAVSFWVTTLAAELQGLSGPPTVGAPSSSPVAVTVSRLVLAKPALLGIPVEIVALRIFQLSKKAGRPATAAGGEGQCAPREEVAGGRTSLPGAVGGLHVVGREVEGGGEKEGVLEAALRGPDLLAVTSCFVDRRAAEIAHIMGSGERGRE